MSQLLRMRKIRFRASPAQFAATPRGTDDKIDAKGGSRVNRGPVSILAIQPASGVCIPEDLLRMPDRNGFELVNGRLVERRGSIRSSEVGSQIALQLGNEAERIGGVHLFGAGLGYRCFLDAPNTVRRPKVSLVRAERMVGISTNADDMPIPPDLAVEVLSPFDSAYEVNEKIEEYLAAAFPLVWVVDPNACVVAIHRGDGSVTKLREADEITGESALPSFRCQVTDFFPVAAAPTAG